MASPCLKVRGNRSPLLDRAAKVHGRVHAYREREEGNRGHILQSVYQELCQKSAQGEQRALNQERCLQGRLQSK